MNRQIGDELMKCIVNSWVKKQISSDAPVDYAHVYDSPKLGEFEADMESVKYCRHYNDCPYHEDCDEKWGTCPYYRDLEATK